MLARYTSVNLSNLKDIYRIEKTDNHHIPYMLHGKRGAVYGLMVQVDNEGNIRPKDRYPLYAVNGKSGAVTRVARYQTEWVMDDLG